MSSTIKKFKVSPFGKIIEKLFALRQKFKDENNEGMQLVVKLLMNSIYGEQIRKDIEEKFSCKSEAWMMSEYVERVIDYWKISGINYIVGKGLLQGKNDYKDGGNWFALFLAPKIKFCLTINKYGVIDEHKTFKGFTNVSDNLDRKEYFKMFQGDKLKAKVPLSLKKSFSHGVVVPHKKRNCNEYTKDLLCDGCDKLVNQRKEFSANLNELKREPPNEFGHMLPKNITT